MPLCRAPISSSRCARSGSMPVPCLGSTMPRWMRSFFPTGSGNRIFFASSARAKRAASRRATRASPSKRFARSSKSLTRGHRPERSRLGHLALRRLGEERDRVGNLARLECCLGMSPIQAQKFCPNRNALGLATLPTRAVANALTGVDHMIEL
jgi:hypothetical protein